MEQQRRLYEVFKDDFMSRQPWRVQLRKGRLAFRRKKDAAEFVEKLIEIESAYGLCNRIFK